MLDVSVCYVRLFDLNEFVNFHKLYVKKKSEEWTFANICGYVSLVFMHVFMYVHKVLCTQYIDQEVGTRSMKNWLLGLKIFQIS